MKINAINPMMVSASKMSTFAGKTEDSKEDMLKGMNGDKLVLGGEAKLLFNVAENVSNEKVGSKFILEPKEDKYKDLRILVTPDTHIEGENFSIGIQKGEPSFKGRLYGSIRKNEDGTTDENMRNEYFRYFALGMDKKADKAGDSKFRKNIRDDYNFFIPTDGDGTRYRDIARLQGGVTKPASRIPATLNGEQMTLVQAVMTNFSKTGKLDDGVDFMDVKPAQGSAYAFLEGLRTGKISTEKPLVYAWGDNFSDVDVSRLIANHEKKGAGFTMTVIPVDKERVSALSIIKVNDENKDKIDIFEEKPTDKNLIESCIMSEYGENKCLSAVGPYVISPEALTWIKDNYTANPESFRTSKGFDFSSGIMTPMLEAMNNGEITREEKRVCNHGSVIRTTERPLDMCYEVIQPKETWSDLGAQKDFSKAMGDIKSGKYIGMPAEIIDSMKKNIDKNGNITFNKQARELFEDMTKQYKIKSKNAIVDCKA